VNRFATRGRSIGLLPFFIFLGVYRVHCPNKFIHVSRRQK
jgi:hypothetical protein